MLLVHASLIGVATLGLAQPSGPHPFELTAGRSDQGTDPSPVSQLGLADLTPQKDGLQTGMREALARGLTFLAAQQEPRRDGSFPAGEDGSHSPIGVTSLCALAFMAGGSLPARGPHGDVVGRAVDYLLAHVTPSGSDIAGYITAANDRQSRTHGHGLATLALAEAYNMSPASTRGRRTALALQAAVERIESSQGSEGGWYYDPLRSVEHEGSVTVCLVQGLRAAHNAGIHVDTRVIARAIDYVQRLQDERGGFRYGLHDDKTTVALTGACLSTLHATGIYDGLAVERGYAYVWREIAARESGQGGGRAAFPYYERFYLSQALWQHRNPTIFADWMAKEAKRILSTQHKDGSWTDRRYGSCYATAMNCLLLALPDGLLPIYQR
ncbi:MAG: hypothetical protein ACI8QZ_000414 [Chlamydiales bacterium]|jgi:hypothetical protein